MDCVGHVDELTRFYIAGWVADRSDWKQSLSVDIIVSGRVESLCKADIFRPQLDQLHPEATGRYAFKFYFSDPLSMYSENDVVVRVHRTAYYLIQSASRIPTIEGRDCSAQRPSMPVLLSTMGRTGSTAVMALLAQHPNIVVAGRRPYEVELGCYYAYALRTLLAAGDHDRSLRTDTITAVENRFHIGFNPYFATSFRDVFKDPQALERYLTNRLPGRIAGAFRELILDYYEDLAKDQSISHPIYFAEKTLPERDARLGVRFMFPNVREVILVRDLRDVICSAMKSNGIPFDRMLESTVAAGRQILAAMLEERAEMLSMKYEDFTLHNAETTATLFRFLGLAPVAADEQGMDELFATHATSATPAASIGRWERDLTPEQRKKCEILDPILDRLGYRTS